ncbi:MAG: NAD(P)-binding protein [Thermoplasmata archaeon]
MKIGIVGAGPSGLYAGILLSKRFDVNIFEEHKVVGLPEHCTGLVTQDVIKRSKKDVVLNKIRGAKIFHGERYFTIEKKDVAAYVIDRVSFEKNFFDEIGDRVNLDTRVKEIKFGSNFMIRTNRGEFSSDILIAADGPRSSIRGYVSNSKTILLNGIQAIMKKEIEDEYVHIFLDRRYSSGFFAWAVPREDDMLVGLATYDNKPLLRLKYLTKDRFGGLEQRRLIGGQIPIGILRKHSRDRIYLTGDAALLVKATSGGGLYYGLLGSEILSDSIINGKSYEKGLSEALRELRRDYIIHKIFSSLRDKEIEKLILSIGHRSVIDEINKYGDIDHPSLVARRLILNKNFMNIYPIILISILRSGIEMFI